MSGNKNKKVTNGDGPPPKKNKPGSNTPHTAPVAVSTTATGGTHTLPTRRAGPIKSKTLEEALKGQFYVFDKKINAVITGSSRGKYIYPMNVLFISYTF